MRHDRRRFRWLAAATALALTITGAAQPAQAAPPTGFPATFEWFSSDIVAGPRPDATHTVDGLKDPTIVFSGGKYHVFASVANADGYNMVYFSFKDFAQASAANHYYLDQSGIGPGYRAAPQVFWFAPQKLWYLVYQNGNAAYSTNPDISDPLGWSAPKTFYPGTPQIITDNIGGGYWVDVWVICDNSTCHLFSSDDNGHLYRSQTSLANFPEGMSEPVIALSDSNRFNLFEAANVYKVEGKNQYLTLVEAIGSDGRRLFRSWTSKEIAGPYTPLADTEANPFARASNVTFRGTPWTQDISHGELIRTGKNQNLVISPCRMRYLYQGQAPDASGPYNSLPWRLGLLTQTNSTC